MRNTSAYLLLFVGTLLLFNRCAQIGALSGGSKDITPPKLVESVPALNSTRFNSDVILLKFDEFVQLKDLSSQLIVTPQLKTNIDLKAEGKNIEISLKKEELKSYTTYRIFIGKAIADMTESNSIENFEYVFSTGDKLDTLQLKGNVSEAFTNKPSGLVSIGLYSTGKKGDSIPYLEKPDYYTRSNESGDFLIKNLPARKFLVYGIADENKNGKYDGEKEKIAFLNSPLDLSSDTTIKLKLFQEEAGKVFIKKVLAPFTGLFQIILNKPSFVSLTALDTSDRTNISETSSDKLKDTIALYYKNISDTLGVILSLDRSANNDTLYLITPKKKSAPKKIENLSLNTSSDKLALESNLKITFPVWMDTTRVDFTKLKFTSAVDSSIATTAVHGRWRNITTFEFDTKLKEGVEYKLKIDTSAFFDINHFSNDSINFKFKVFSKNDFGKVRLNVKVNKKEAYIIQLINDQNFVSKEEFIRFSLSSSNAVSIDFTNVTPGNYFVKIIIDLNNNHNWDRGDILMKKLPEEVIINSKQIKVLSDWEIEEEISIH
jgi:uncharacterized protein (DUF2141 family)